VNFRIGSQQVLLLKAAFSSSKSEAIAALDRWWANVADFDEVRGTDANLFPQIYWNVGSQIQDPTLRGRLKGAARHHWVRNQYLIASGGQVLDLLAGGAVPVLLLKGAAIASSMDQDLGLRAMSDCDMLVPRDRALEVIEMLARSDLLEPGRASRRDLDVSHGITLALRKSRHAAFDLHWRPLRAVGAEELAEEMFANARPTAFAGRPCLVPASEHLVLHAIVHGFEWSPFPRYDWLVDTIKVLRRAGGTFDWCKLSETARRYRFGCMVGAALGEARARMGIAIPDGATRRLSRPFAVLERLEGRARLARTASRSVPTELLLALQGIRRQSRQHLEQPLFRSLSALAQSVLGPFSASRTFIHNDRQEPITYLLGWSAPEATGRWSEGRLASIALFAPGGARPTSLMLRCRPFAHRATRAHKVGVFAGLQRLGTMRWRKSGVGPHVQEVRLPETIWRHDTAILRFRVRTPASPIETGLNGDTRALGIFVEHMSVEPPVRNLAAAALDLSSAGADRDVMRHGWSHPETSGCWTEGKIAVLRWRASKDIAAGSTLHAEVAATAPGRKHILGRLAVNESWTMAFRCPPSTSGPRLSLRLPERIPAATEMVVSFEIENPRRSAKDPRRLGLLVRRVWLDAGTA
jgi:hypothetical protein